MSSSSPELDEGTQCVVGRVLPALQPPLSWAAPPYFKRKKKKKTLACPLQEAEYPSCSPGASGNHLWGLETEVCPLWPPGWNGVGAAGNRKAGWAA